MLIALICVTIKTNAQIKINWNDINLAGAEAKVLTVIPPVPEPLTIKSFETNEGKINVYLPPLSSGATISGTVVTESKGQNEKEKARNQAALQAYLLTLGPENIPIRENSFSIPVMAAIPRVNTSSLQLKTSAGQLIKTEDLPLTSSPSSSNFRTLIPPYVVSGDITALPGNFDGSSKTTLLKINGSTINVIAESPNALYFTPPSTHTGPSTIECNDKGKTTTARVNVINLELSAPKTNLRRGEKTQITVRVSGLEGLKENVPVIITNTSPSVITLEGGNTQPITVVPSKDAAAGVFTISRNILSMKNGSFSVSVTVSPFSTTMH